MVIFRLFVKYTQFFLTFVFMRFNFVSLTVCAVLLSAVGGCRMHPETGRSTIPAVERILGDPDCREAKILAAFDPRNTQGDIVLIDNPERCFALSEALVKCDARDNIDGTPGPDFLPDFAGERITTLIDLQYPPYARFLEAENSDALREVSVRAVISALDTACCLGPFDHEFRSSKPVAKLLVVSSPYMTAYGGFDIDTLFRSSGVRVPVVSATEVMMQQALSSREGAVLFGMLSDRTTAASGVYQNVFRNLARKRGDQISRVFCFSLPDKEETPDSLAAAQPDLLKHVLDQYSRSGENRALNALVVDDVSVSVESLLASYANILNSPSDENAYYRKLISRDFVIIDGIAAVTDACYSFLRGNNLFTHNIAYPDAKAYITSPEGGIFTLMDFEFSEIPVELIASLEKLAPKTLSLYVQDQHKARGN